MGGGSCCISTNYTVKPLSKSSSNLTCGSLSVSPGYGWAHIAAAVGVLLGVGEKPLERSHRRVCAESSYFQSTPSTHHAPLSRLKFLAGGLSVFLVLWVFAGTTKPLLYCDALTHLEHKMELRSGYF